MKEVRQFRKRHFVDLVGLIMKKKLQDEQEHINRIFCNENSLNVMNAETQCTELPIGAATDASAIEQSEGDSVSDSALNNIIIPTVSTCSVALKKQSYRAHVKRYQNKSKLKTNRRSCNNVSKLYKSKGNFSTSRNSVSPGNHARIPSVRQTKKESNAQLIAEQRRIQEEIRHRQVGVLNRESENLFLNGNEISGNISESSIISAIMKISRLAEIENLERNGIGAELFNQNISAKEDINGNKPTITAHIYAQNVENLSFLNCGQKFVGKIIIEPMTEEENTLKKCTANDISDSTDCRTSENKSFRNQKSAPQNPETTFDDEKPCCSKDIKRHTTNLNGLATQLRWPTTINFPIIQHKSAISINNRQENLFSNKNDTSLSQLWPLPNASNTINLFNGAEPFGNYFSNKFGNNDNNRNTSEVEEKLTDESKIKASTTNECGDKNTKNKVFYFGNLLSVNQIENKNQENGSNATLDTEVRAENDEKNDGDCVTFPVKLDEDENINKNKKDDTNHEGL